MDENTPLLARLSSIPKKKNKIRFKWVVISEECELDKKKRFNSIRLCYLIMLLSSISFTISLSSMMPYLSIIEKGADPAFYGWIVSSYCIAQLVSSPFFGWLANKIKFHKLPLVICLLIMALGNAIYFYLESFPLFPNFHPKDWMLIARIIIGLGASCAALTRSYCSSASSMEEKTSILSNLSASQGIGFVLGPALQAAFVPIDFPGPVSSKWFHLNMYTAPALVSFLIYISLAILTTFCFDEYVIAIRKQEEPTSESEDIENSENGLFNSIQDVPNETKTSKRDSFQSTIKNLPSPDYCAAILALILFFINYFVFSFFETLISPLVLYMYGWSKKDTTLYNGILLGVIGLLSVIFVLVTKILARRFKEKQLLLIGYIILLISVIILLPWGNTYSPIQIQTLGPSVTRTTIQTINSTRSIDTNMTTNYANVTTTVTSIRSTEESPRGCPADYKWCYFTPIVKIWQFLLGFALLIIGYSIANIMSFAIFSKILGPKPQGTWMGILTSCGSLSRAIGAIVVSNLFEFYGTRVSFIFLACVSFLGIIIIVSAYKKFEPYKFCSKTFY